MKKGNGYIRKVPLISKNDNVEKRSVQELFVRNINKNKVRCVVMNTIKSANFTTQAHQRH